MTLRTSRSRLTRDFHLRLITKIPSTRSYVNQRYDGSDTRKRAYRRYAASNNQHCYLHTYSSAFPPHQGSTRLPGMWSPFILPA